LRLVLCGVDDRQVIGARVKETNHSVPKLDDFDCGRHDPCTHHGRRSLLLKINRACLRSGLLYDALVKIPPEGGFGGLELETCRIHLAQHLVQMAGLGLRRPRGWCCD
jgi:hypothetical protein